MVINPNGDNHLLWEDHLYTATISPELAVCNAYAMETNTKQLHGKVQLYMHNYLSMHLIQNKSGF